MRPRWDTSRQKHLARSCFSSSDMLPKRVASMAICSARPLPASSAARCSLLCVESTSPVAKQLSRPSDKCGPDAQGPQPVRQSETCESIEITVRQHDVPELFRQTFQHAAVRGGRLDGGSCRRRLASLLCELRESVLDLSMRGRGGLSGRLRGRQSSVPTP
eukprot:scaffold81453_cov79-Phaeocystis_antarctica.AAC.1